MTLLITANYMAVVLLLICICVQDITSRLIANKYVIAIGVAACTLSLLHGQWPNLIFFATVLTLGFFLCMANIIGGGDIKLISALSLLYTPSQFPQFLFLTALSGGAVALVCLLFFLKTTKQNGVPYGVAISFAFIFSYSIN